MPTILFLTAYPEGDASCRYRIHPFAPYLENAGYECTIAPFATDKLFHSIKRRGGLAAKSIEMLRCAARRLALLPRVEDHDIVFIHRDAFPFFSPAIENLVLKRAKRSRRKTKVIFSFDDAIYAGHEDVSTLSHPRLYRWKHGRGYDEVMRSADHVIAGNRILADYARQLNAATTVIPTVVDCGKYQMRAIDVDSSRPITIGWMGSPTTAPYLRMIEPALQRIEKTHGAKVQFRFVGCPEYTPDLDRVTSVPFRLETEIQELQQFDIGLMPLPDTAWSRGKCAFKAIQYMASGVATVASPVGITPEVVHDGATGFLASTSQQWVAALDQLIVSASLRSRIAIEARRCIETNYSLQAWAPPLIALFDQLSGRAGILERETIAA